MRQLIYVSAAAWSMTDADLASILAAARRNNPARDVTGMLLYINMGFLQILEGPASGVEAIYARIVADRRHAAQRVLIDEEAGGRLFSQWSMGFDRPSPQLTAAGDVFAATREAIEANVPLETAAVAARLVRTFYSVNAGSLA